MISALQASNLCPSIDGGDIVIHGSVQHGHPDAIKVDLRLKPILAQQDLVTPAVSPSKPLLVLENIVRGGLNGTGTLTIHATGTLPDPETNKPILTVTTADVVNGLHHALQAPLLHSAHVHTIADLARCLKADLGNRELQELPGAEELKEAEARIQAACKKRCAEVGDDLQDGWKCIDLLLENPMWFGMA